MKAEGKRANTQSFFLKKTVNSSQGWIRISAPPESEDRSDGRTRERRTSEHGFATTEERKRKKEKIKKKKPSQTVNKTKKGWISFFLTKNSPNRKVDIVWLDVIIDNP